MKRIPLNGKLGRGKFALVDDQDYALLSQHRWYLTPKGYASAYPCKNGLKASQIKMHRVIMNPPKTLVVDHINHNKLDNRRCNLRVVSELANRQNPPRGSLNTSGTTGVFLRKDTRTWQVQITRNNKKLSLGSYKKKELAVAVRLACDRLNILGYLHSGVTPQPPATGRSE